jgi:hypothetical protein
MNKKRFGCQVELCESNKQLYTFKSFGVPEVNDEGSFKVFLNY